MRAQFYILSIVILVATIVTFAVGILESPSPEFSPDQTAFLLNNLETQAQIAFDVGKKRNTLDTTFKEFTETTKTELAKEQISLKWDYDISYVKADITLTLKSSNTIVTDSWTIE